MKIKFEFEFEFKVAFKIVSSFLSKICILMEILDRIQMI